MENIKKICIDNPNYPKILRQIKDPPKVLYVLGDETILNNKMISIVGSRICTNYGKKAAFEFAKKLSDSGLTIISGMAVGIDTEAHLGCMKSKSKTIAVLGSGLGNIYPQENVELFNKIINQGGAVITEYSKNTKPASENFPQRNRIVSGMSIGTLIVEAGYRSGATITAGLTKRSRKKGFWRASKHRK